MSIQYQFLISGSKLSSKLLLVFMLSPVRKDGESMMREATRTVYITLEREK